MNLMVFQLIIISRNWWNCRAFHLFYSWPGNRKIPRNSEKFRKIQKKSGKIPKNSEKSRQTQWFPEIHRFFPYSPVFQRFHLLDEWETSFEWSMKRCMNQTSKTIAAIFINGIHWLFCKLHNIVIGMNVQLKCYYWLNCTYLKSYRAYSIVLFPFNSSYFHNKIMFWWHKWSCLTKKDRHLCVFIFLLWFAC